MVFSPNVSRLEPSATIAISSLAKKLRAEGRDIINLSAGEPDFDTPSALSEAAIEAIRRGLTRYTPAAGLTELRQAIASYLSGRAGREVPWEGVVVTSGAKQALFNACFSLFGPGDEVMIASPYWTSYPQMVGLSGAEPVYVHGDESREFRLTTSDLDAALTDQTRGLIYSSPCNPTGTVYSAEELEAMATWARDNDVWLLADEIYRRIYFGEGGEAPGVLDLPTGSLGNFVLIDGASKSFAMTGWRLGFCWTLPEVAAKMAALQSHSTSNAASPSQAAALAAYTDLEGTETAVAQMRQAFARRRDLVVRLFGELLPDFPYVTPRGAFYLFFRVDSTFDDQRRDASGFCSWLLEEAGVALVPGGAFGDARWVRMSYAASDEMLEESIRRMAAAMEG